MSIRIVSGTGTAVGKTLVTAAMAALAVARGARVAVLKPVQTGVTPAEPGDLACVRELAGAVTTRELQRYPAPLSPEAAARCQGADTMTTADMAAAAVELQQRHDLVLIEGAGGLLVRFNAQGATLADVAARLDAAVVVTVDPGLGTLNSTALTAEVAAARAVHMAGVVIGRWPQVPNLAAYSNVIDLPVVANAPLLGVLRDGLAASGRAEFLGAAQAGLAPSLGGAFDARAFATACGPAST